MKKIRFDRLVVSVMLFLALLFLFSFRASAKEVTSAILESNWTPAIIWIFSFTSVVLDRLYCRNLQQGSGFIYTNFGAYADAIFCIATFGFSGSTSIALLNGIYLQIFFDKLNFIGFGNFDLASIIVISSFLLFYSLNEMLKLIIGVIYQVEASPVKTA